MILKRLSLWLISFFLFSFSFPDDEENPCLFQHVNLISGQLNLIMEDGQVEGAIRLPINKAYSSAGALEIDADESDLFLKKLRQGFIIQGGWSLFPQTHMLIRPSRRKEGYVAYVTDKSGSVCIYDVEKKEGHNHVILRPSKKYAKTYGKISGKFNRKQSFIRLNEKEGKATLHLADGSRFFYKGKHFQARRAEGAYGTTFYTLMKEEHPSQYKILYEYDKKDRLKGIRCVNKREDKTYSSLLIDLEKATTPYRFQLISSDGKKIDYEFKEIDQRDYLHTVESTFKAKEFFDYTTGRKGAGARVNNIYLDNQQQCRIFYYLPKKKEMEKVRRHPDKKGHSIDKVERIEAPIGNCGEYKTIARFSYQENQTDIRDVDNLLIRFHHKEGLPTRIEYFDDHEKICYTTIFIYQDAHLIGKVRLDENLTPLFSKTFKYDEYGNITEENFFGNITGNAKEIFSLNDDGSLNNADSFKKTYRYSQPFNLLIEENEEGSICSEYKYIEGTDLLSAKYTKFDDKILKREFFSYDENFLLIEEIIDDGNCLDKDDISSIKERRLKRYFRNSNDGQITRFQDLYFDKNLSKEIPIKESHYEYSKEHKIIAEKVFDSSGLYRYAIYKEYDRFGNCIHTATSYGEKNKYEYDKCNRLIFKKEIGELAHRFFYDTQGNIYKEQQIDADGFIKEKITEFDLKGHPIRQQDFFGNWTFQEYDCFGRCIKTILSSVLDENGDSYEPQISYGYDKLGNLCFVQDPRGCITKTEYTTLRKPCKITSAEGFVTEHKYNLNDTIKETKHPDGSLECFEYDPFGRVTNKKIFSAQNDLLSEEVNSFSTFHKESSKDDKGLTTYYEYDGAGRLILENTSGRLKQYEYDDLGFLSSSKEGPIKKVQIHDEAGRVSQAWDEDENQKKENWIQFFYDEENRKIKALRTTQEGLSVDLFSYDSEGRLCSHIDPLGYRTQYLYDRNEHIKTEINPLGISTIEKWDLLKRLIQKRRIDETGKEVSKEDIFYDKSGNQARRVSSFFREDNSIEHHTLSWSYDLCNRIIKQQQSSGKSTHFEYDCMGRMIQKTLPSHLSLNYQYDSLGRLLEQKSSCGKIHIIYHYDKGMDPNLIEDLIQGTYIKRSYDLFGQLLSESSSYGIDYLWDYDHEGRITKLTLPDQSNIFYTYDGMHLKKIERQTKENLQYQHVFDEWDVNGLPIKQTPIFSIDPIHFYYDLMGRAKGIFSSQYSFSHDYNPIGFVIKKSASLFGDTLMSYDALDQIKKEADRTYHFDSLGNPKEAIINQDHQILFLEGVQFDYDADGNLVQKRSNKEQTTYCYDPLGRLTSFTSDMAETTFLSYDPLSRLISFECRGKTKFFLYDNDTEIGSLNENKQIEDLKIIPKYSLNKEELPVAIEIDGEVFQPINDLSGNIIGLLSLDLSLFESYEMTCFGRRIQETKKQPINPWRFQSKRHIEDLVFFGYRFYDPSISRWLSQDPLGFADGVNPYVFSSNTPSNRMDLFGLFAEPRFTPYDVKLEVPIHLISKIPLKNEAQALKGSIDGVEIDWLIKGGNWSKLQISEQELCSGKINLIDHFHEIIPNQGNTLGFISFQNGIQTNLKEAKEMVNLIHQSAHPDTLVLSLYSPSCTLLKDINQACYEITQIKQTHMTALTRQYLVALSSSLYKVNPESFWLHIAHSRGGGIATRALEGLTLEQQEMIRSNLIYYGIGASIPMPENLAKSSKNIYSEQDFITSRFGKKFLRDKNYQIHFTECLTPIKDRLLYPFLSDHSFFGETYMKAVSREIRNYK